MTTKSPYIITYTEWNQTNTSILGDFLDKVVRLMGVSPPLVSRRGEAELHHQCWSGPARVTHLGTVSCLTNINLIPFSGEWLPPLPPVSNSFPPSCSTYRTGLYSYLEYLFPSVTFLYSNAAHRWAFFSFYLLFSSLPFYGTSAFTATKFQLPAQFSLTKIYITFIRHCSPLHISFTCCHYKISQSRLLLRPSFLFRCFPLLFFLQYHFPSTSSQCSVPKTQEFTGFILQIILPHTRSIIITLFLLKKKKKNLVFSLLHSSHFLCPLQQSSFFSFLLPLFSSVSPLPHVKPPLSSSLLSIIAQTHTFPAYLLSPLVSRLPLSPLSPSGFSFPRLGAFHHQCLLHVGSVYISIP